MRKILPIILLVVLLGLVLRLVTLGPSRRQPLPDKAELRVHFIDVGQGDCTLIRTPDGRTVLVGAGSRGAAETVVGYLTSCGVRRIDLLVIAHPHEDHIGGLPAVLETFGVSRVIDMGWGLGREPYGEVLSSIKERKIDYRLACDQPTPQVSKDVEFEILWPRRGRRADTEASPDDGSVVMRLRYGSATVLLAGNIRYKVEGKLLAECRDLRGTILRVAHYGSAEGTSNEFLQVVKPDYAVISVGAGNPYGYPAATTLKRLKAAGARVFRTDADGTVIIITDGRRVRMETER